MVFAQAGIFMKSSAGKHGIVDKAFPVSLFNRASQFDEPGEIIPDMVSEKRVMLSLTASLRPVRF
jgi:hypothetical protein